jgi:hypothetical protein
VIFRAYRGIRNSNRSSCYFAGDKNVLGTATSVVNLVELVADPRYLVPAPSEAVYFLPCRNKRMPSAPSRVISSKKASTN